MPSASNDDLDAIVQRIRDSATPPEADDTAPGSSASPAAVTYDELLASGSDETFVSACYRTILHREPDAPGKAGLLQRLHAGERRSRLIVELHESPEARALGARLPGLGAAAAIYRLAERLRAKPLVRPLGECMARFYSAWRNCRLVLNGQGMRRQGNILAWLREQQLHDAQRLRRELEGLRMASVSALQDAMQQAEHRQQASDESRQELQLSHRQLELRVQQQQLRIQQLEKLLDKQSGRIVVAEGQLIRLREPSTQGHLPQRAFADDQATRAKPSPTPAANPIAHAHPSTDEMTARLDAYYVAFEDAHRGTEDNIRERLSVYLDRLATAPSAALAFPVLDIGCGRGEWLRLLGENGFQAIGIDLNREMVEHCQRHGLQAHHVDALTWLMAQPDESVSVISAFHVVEHLPFDVLFQMIDHARRVLIPGGLLVLETPNPENILVGSHTFYHDFSHRNPVTPVSLQFLLEYQGLDVSELLRLHPYPEEARVAGDSPVVERVNGHFCGPQDYGVIAAKPLRRETDGDQRAVAAADSVAPEVSGASEAP
ncbi:methyltransferase domain-containing protein [Marinobacter sp.]|uniref:methyltransferase domain-containing protein n=1 Tax=Marinobacter sp. TaxID=50741 RepID=UPI003A9127D6